MKIGLQVCQMLDKEILRQRLTNAAKLKTPCWTACTTSPLDVDARRKNITPWQADRAHGGRRGPNLHKRSKGQTHLLEGQLGTPARPRPRHFPLTTSSSPLAGFARWARGCR
jgi:adenylosuccinate synthase